MTATGQRHARDMDMIHSSAYYSIFGVSYTALIHNENFQIENKRDPSRRNHNSTIQEKSIDMNSQIYKISRRQLNGHPQLR